MNEIGRREVQAIALDFIRSQNGPERLSSQIKSQVNQLGAARCIVDGIRHLATYESLTVDFDGRTHGSLEVPMTARAVARVVSGAQLATKSSAFKASHIGWVNPPGKDRA
jgi:hypothetical protein